MDLEKEHFSILYGETEKRLNCWEVSSHAVQRFFFLPVSCKEGKHKS